MSRRRLLVLVVITVRWFVQPPIHAESSEFEGGVTPPWVTNQETWNLLRDLGARSVADFLSWRAVVGDDEIRPAALTYDWDHADHIISDMNRMTDRHGRRPSIVLGLTLPPQWALEGARATLGQAWINPYPQGASEEAKKRPVQQFPAVAIDEGDYDALEEFVRKFVERYDGDGIDDGVQGGLTLRVNYLHWFNEVDNTFATWENQGGIFAGIYGTPYWDVNNNGQGDFWDYAQLISHTRQAMWAAQGQEGPIKLVLARLAYDGFRFGPEGFTDPHPSGLLIAQDNLFPSVRSGGIFDPYFLHNVLVTLESFVPHVEGIETTADFFDVVDVHHYQGAGWQAADQPFLNWVNIGDKANETFNSYLGIREELSYHGAGGDPATNTPQLITTEFGKDSDGQTLEALDRQARAVVQGLTSAWGEHIKPMHWFTLYDPPGFFQPRHAYGLLMSTDQTREGLELAWQRIGDLTVWTKKPSYFAFKRYTEKLHQHVFSREIEASERTHPDMEGYRFVNGNATTWVVWMEAQDASGDVILPPEDYPVTVTTYTGEKLMVIDHGPMTVNELQGPLYLEKELSTRPQAFSTDQASVTFEIQTGSGSEHSSGSDPSARGFPLHLSGIVLGILGWYMVLVGTLLCAWPPLGKQLADWWLKDKMSRAWALGTSSLGVLLLWAASGSRAPIFIQLLGGLAILKGGYLIIAPRTRLRSIVNWWNGLSPGNYRLVGLLTVALGAVLVAAAR